MILTAIGPELAAGFLRELAEPDMERFARAIGGLGKISQDVLDAVIVEFLELLTTGPEISGGSKAARKLLAAVLDDEDEVAAADRRPPAERGPLGLGAAERHAGADARQLPAGRAPADRGGGPERAARRGRRRACSSGSSAASPRPSCCASSRVPTLDPPVSAAIQGAIERDFLSVLQRNLSKRRPADLIAGLMNNISTEVREGFLGYLEAQEPSLAQDVQRTMFTFEDIAVRLHGRDVAGVLRDVPEEVLLKALKLGEAQGSATVGFILENLPRRLSERYVEELAAPRPTSAARKASRRRSRSPRRSRRRPRPASSASSRRTARSAEPRERRRLATRRASRLACAGRPQAPGRERERRMPWTQLQHKAFLLLLALVTVAFFWLLLPVLRRGLLGGDPRDRVPAAAARLRAPLRAAQQPAPRR